MVTGEIDCGLIVKFIDSGDDIDNNQKGILWFCSKPRKVAECVLLNRTEHTDRNHRLQSGKKAKYLLSLSFFFFHFIFFYSTVESRMFCCCDHCFNSCSCPLHSTIAAALFCAVGLCARVRIRAY